MNDEELQNSDDIQDQQTEVEGQVDAGAEQPEQQVSEDLILGKFENADQLAHGYQELERAFHGRRDKIKEEVLSELAAEHDSNVPESPGDYSMTAEYNGDTIEIPDTPMTAWFRDKAHTLGMDQEQFHEIAIEYMQMEQMQGPVWDDEAAQLGEHADMRHQRVDSWAKAHLSEDNYNTFAAIPASAAMIQTFEQLMEIGGEPQFKMVDSNSFQEELTSDDLKEMQNDPKYWRDHDPAFIAKVRNGFKQLSMKKHGTI